MKPPLDHQLEAAESGASEPLGAHFCESWVVSAVQSHRILVVPAGAVLLATVVAGATIGVAATVSTPFDLRFALGGVAAAVPVGLVLAGLSMVRPQAAVLALIEVLTFAVALLADTAATLWIAVLATLIVGVAAVLWRRARPADVLLALLVGYMAAAVIYEVGIPLHNLL